MGHLKSVMGFLVSTPGRWRRVTWRMVLYLSPWRSASEPTIRTMRLRVEIPLLKEEEVKNPMEDLTKGASVALECESLEPPGPRRCWFARGSLPVQLADADREMTEAHLKLIEPVTIDDPVLGSLTLNREYNSYVGRCQRPAMQFNVWVRRSTMDEDRALDGPDLERASTVVLHVEGRLAEYRTEAARELVGIWKRYHLLPMAQFSMLASLDDSRILSRESG
jgi:hypothetical protein